MDKLEKILNTKIEVSSKLILDLISCIDLTSLNNTDTQESLKKTINKANTGYKGIHPAAVCVFSNFGDYVKSELNPRINVAVVSTCFPNGQTIQEVKLFEVECVNKSTVDEVDIVISRGEMLNGNYGYVENEIKLIRDRLPNKHLKVILETGELKTEKYITKASEIAIKSGTDFIKTSTGKSHTGSTPQAVYYMCKVIKQHYQSTGKKIGIKPAGGIRDLNDALEIYKIVNSVLGDSWLNPKLLRFGASSLFDNLINEYESRFN